MLVYLDDIIIYAKNEKDHDKLVREILDLLEKKNFKINKEKLILKKR